MHQVTYHRTGAHPHPFEYFQGIFGEMHPAGYCRIYCAESEGRPVAYLNVAQYRQKAFFWTGCSLDNALHSGVNFLLQYNAMLQARKEGCTHYEIGEAFPGHRDDKLAGLDAFKRSFGGQRRPFFKGRTDLEPERKPSALRLFLYYQKESLKAVLRK